EARGDEVQRTEWRLRCAQPPYDAIPIPLADIPPGYILSREADAWIHEEEVEDVALPVYHGMMVWQFDPAFNEHVSGNKWEELAWSEKRLTPRYLMRSGDRSPDLIRLIIRDVSSPTNKRTFVATLVPNYPSGHKTPILTPTHRRRH